MPLVSRYVCITFLFFKGIFEFFDCEWPIVGPKKVFSFTHAVQSIINFGNMDMGLEVNGQSMRELVDEQSEGLSNEELKDIHLEVQFMRYQ